jgi:gliding motility-associated-like protein
MQTGFTYSWSTVGTINTGQGTNTVNTNWNGVSSGFIPGGVQVTAYDSNGCYSLPMSIDLYVLNITPSIVPIGPFCSYDAAITMTATPIGGVFTGPGVTGNQFDPVSAIGNYTINYTYTSSGCTFTTTTPITVYQQPTIDSLTPYNQFLEICEGDSVVSSYSVVYDIPGYNEWTFGGQSLQIENFVHTWNSPGMFVITVVHYSNGCISNQQQTSITVEECPQSIFYIPNTFTPNGDGNNNIWQPVFTSGIDPYNFVVRIFNRWGETVWESNNPNIGWDGTYMNETCSIGIYQFSIIFKDLKSGKKQVTQGHINLLR